MKRRKFLIVAIVFAIVCNIACSDKDDNNSTSDKVLIGIAWRADTDSEFYTNIVRAIQEAGGTPVMLNQVYPNGYQLAGNTLLDSYTDEQGVLLQQYADEVKTLSSEKSNVSDAVNNVYAVVFTGGEDISPTLLRTPEPWHGIEEEKDYNATRDISDYITLNYCLEKDIPMMGMCRGMQMLSVVSGATIIQDIPTYFADQGITYEYLHRNQSNGGYRDYSPHNVSVTDKNSILYSVTSTENITGAPSWHHQAVGNINGTPLKITGQTNTQGINIIEAVERPDKSFCIGLQYHPEAALVKHLDKKENASKFMSYDNALSYFKELVKQAKIYKSKKNKK